MTRIAYLSPLPPERTGIADYSRWLLPELAARVEVDAYAPRGAERPRGVRLVRPTSRALSRLDRYDAVVAHVGNSDAHGWILRALPRARPTVVLHELVLHHLVAHVTLGRGDGEGYVAAMTRERGLVGRVLAQLVLDGIVPPLWEAAPERYPLTSAATGHASALIVHSRFVAGRVRSRWPDLPVATIPHLCPPAEGVEPERPDGDPLFGVFGFVTPQKRLPVIFRAFARARRDLPRARLLVVGSAPPDLNPRRLAAAAGLDRDAVEIIGYTDAGRFARLLAGVDVGVSLRHPTLGETSGAVVRWLGVGVPVVVSTGGWYDELPDEAVVRIAPDEAEEESLATALARLGSDPDLRRRMGDAGRAHARERMAPGAVADAYLRFLLAPRGRRALADRLLASLAGALADVAPASARSAVGLPRRLGQAAREAGVL